MKSPDVAIQIVNYKTKAFLDPLLDSITKDIANSKISFEINILDNASGDDLTKIGERWQNRHVHVYTSETNGGFGAGHNILANKTTARYLLILNPDILLMEPRTIERLMSTLTETGAAVVGPRLLMPRLQTLKPLPRYAASDLKQQHWDHGTYKMLARYQAKQRITPVAWVSGAVFLIRRDLFEAVGGFDERYFLYYEELDLCRKLHMQGQRIIYDPGVQVLHYGSASTRGNGKYRHSVKSFFRFHMSRLSG